MRAVHQVLPSYARRDAIGAHVLQLQRLLHAQGVASEVFAAGHEDPPGPCRDASELAAAGGPGVAWLYHLSTGHPLAEELAERPEPLIVDHHNITPHDAFGRWEPSVAPELALGRSQLPMLAARMARGLADSAYNAGELLAAGGADVHVVPILLDAASLVAQGDAVEAARLQAERAARGGADWLFIGRVAPHKAQHELVAALAAYRQAYDPEARLTLIGGSSSHAYLTALERYVDALDLDDAVRILGSTSAGVLGAHLATADVFVCASDHEGFCVPVLEAMVNGVPVVAHAAAAVPETVGGAGLLLPRKDPTLLATAVHRVLVDPALRERLTAAGRARAATFSLARAQDLAVAALRPFLGGPR